MERIQSFNVNHDYIVPGMYISRTDGTITTYDLRFRKPNGGHYLDNITMHSIEHMFATYIRNDEEVGSSVIYFGPMGCQTGFYLLMNNVAPEVAYHAVLRTLDKIIEHTGPMFGATRAECGNFINLSVSIGKQECRRYFKALSEQTDMTLSYSKEAIENV